MLDPIQRCDHVIVAGEIGEFGDLRCFCRPQIDARCETDTKDICFGPVDEVEIEVVANMRLSSANGRAAACRRSARASLGTFCANKLYSWYLDHRFSFVVRLSCPAASHLDRHRSPLVVYQHW